VVAKDAFSQDFSRRTACAANAQRTALAGIAGRREPRRDARESCKPLFARCARLSMTLVV
jgi:hypothetical protein